MNDAIEKQRVRRPIEDAHDVGLFVHAYTWRNEGHLLSDYGGQPMQDCSSSLPGRHGVFSDNPDTAVTSRTLFWNVRQAACAPWR